MCAVARRDSMAPPLAGESFKVLVAETTTGLRHAPPHLDPQRPHP